jgi:hypothetical protein
MVCIYLFCPSVFMHQQHIHKKHPQKNCSHQPQKKLSHYFFFYGTFYYYLHIETHFLYFHFPPQTTIDASIDTLMIYLLLSYS